MDHERHGFDSFGWDIRYRHGTTRGSGHTDPHVNHTRSYGIWVDSTGLVHALYSDPPTKGGDYCDHEAHESARLITN